jgi:hypothetical protein
MHETDEAIGCSLVVGESCWHISPVVRDDGVRGVAIQSFVFLADDEAMALASKIANATAYADDD